MAVNLRELTHQNTSQYTGDTFLIHLEDGSTIEAVLEDVTVMMEKHLNPRMQRDAFAMHFRGPRTPVLAQGIYTVTHEQLGELQIFLVPLSAPPEGALYEALFN